MSAAPRVQSCRLLDETRLQSCPTTETWPWRWSSETRTNTNTKTTHTAQQPIFSAIFWNSSAAAASLLPSLCSYSPCTTPLSFVFSCCAARKMPGRRVRDESAITSTTTTVPAVPQRSAATRSVRARRERPSGYSGYEYAHPADRLQTVENDPHLLALPSAHFAQRIWMMANAHKLRLEAEWQDIKLFYITMTDFAKLQKSLDREVNPLEVALEPWLAMMRDNMMVRIAHSRMPEDALIQFDMLHASLWIRIDEGRVADVQATMASIQALFDDHAKLWLDYNACIPVPHRLKMAALFAWAMEKWVTQPADGLALDGGIFRRQAVPEIMAHVITVYCDS